MKATILFAAVLCLLHLPGTGVHAAERVAVEWDFSKASDTLGWVTAEPLDTFRVQSGALSVAPGPGAPKLESPLFDIEATPSQFVEIEMKSDTGGTGLIYYSNTTDPPYHGFRGELHTSFEVPGDGQYRTYTVYPFWQRQKKLTHIRIDPPGKNVEIRAVRIVSAASGAPAETSSWSFNGTDGGWIPKKTETKTLVSPKSIDVTGNRDSLFMSPPLDVDSSEKLWATIRLTSRNEGVVLFRWVSDKADGLQSMPILVRGDGTVHSYPIDLSKAPGWSGKIMAVGITPTDSSDAEMIKLESIDLAKEPTGPPEPRITRFGPDEPFIRVGDKVKLVVEATNIGGHPAKELGAAVTLPSATTAEVLHQQRISLLKPGEKKRFEWEFTAKTEGVQTAVARVNAFGLEGDEKLIRLIVYPKLTDAKLKATKQVPEPAPADTGDYLVGAYYYPGWQIFERWAVLNDFQERRPLLGYYAEGDPQVADWHVKWALDHGISYFIYDWYWTKGTRILEHALHDGLFKSKYGGKMKFCLLWANHNPNGTSSAQDCEDVTKYWIENYFKRPNYLKINGKNVVVIFSTHRLSQDMGGQAVRASFDKMRKMCEDAGVGGLYMVACTYPGKDRVSGLEAEGYDALSGYNYPSAGSKDRKITPYEWMVDEYPKWWAQIADESSLPYIPVCEPGWDSRPWHGLSGLVRTGKSPALWEKMLESAKAFVDDPKRKKPDGKKLVFLEAWNEFGEGDYIEPHEEFGFDYLEAVRSVFAPKSREPVLVVPRDVGLGPYALTDPGVKTEWDFSKPADRGWVPCNMTDFSYDSGVMSARAVNLDPIFYSPRISIDAGTFGAVEVKMRMDAGDEGQAFFSTRPQPMDEEKSVKFKVIGDGEYHVYEIDMTKNPRWRGKIDQIRIDPNHIEGSKVDVAYIKFK